MNMLLLCMLRLNVTLFPLFTLQEHINRVHSNHNDDSMVVPLPIPGERKHAADVTIK